MKAQQRSIKVFKTVVVMDLMHYSRFVTALKNGEIQGRFIVVPIKENECRNNTIIPLPLQEDGKNFLDKLFESSSTDESRKVDLVMYPDIFSPENGGEDDDDNLVSFPMPLDKVDWNGIKILSKNGLEPFSLLCSSCKSYVYSTLKFCSPKGENCKYSKTNQIVDYESMFTI